ncbi:hypothetical protein PFICI_02034 [Pestalotiopsis fici W106-1]|uniref:Uncharacterized protein n=1 Tax=Pestalotiopsis fici (strain W106-1 / CGMCC3.15140) TaxID=1229662 RepID=W3XSL4_PESFW|nr:uncharacterized protein PFICI_02034 [Pestalotiopsis fici W106-1]ETS88206.1 hypothetical protein PFICI_02034 [Pestalotiopsis fici W106-1]
MVSFDCKILVASIAVAAVSAGYHVSPPPPPPPPPPPTTVSPDCFTLSALYANGTHAGLLYLYEHAESHYGSLTNYQPGAAKLALDTSTGRLIDYESAPNHNGLIAAAYRNAGFFSEVFFKTDAQLQGISDYIALKCELSSTGILTCNHPMNAKNFFQCKSSYSEVSDVSLL